MTFDTEKLPVMKQLNQRKIRNKNSIKLIMEAQIIMTYDIQKRGATQAHIGGKYEGQIKCTASEVFK